MSFLRLSCSLVAIAALGRGLEDSCPLPGGNDEAASLMQLREVSQVGDGKCKCTPSDGDNVGPYSYPVVDNTSCLCTNWNGKHDTTCGNSFQGCSKHHVIPGAPWGLVFFGVSLSRYHGNVPTANRASVTHQTKFDFNRLQDRANQYLCKTSDDGWLTGGGNGPSSFVLPHIDSAHMELIHPGSICANVAPTSEVQPDTSSYTKPPRNVTGASFTSLVERVRRDISFDPLRVVPTEGVFTETQEYQLRFNPYDQNNNSVNPTMTALYNKLVNEFLQIQVLDISDPFHMSMCRETAFCNARSRNTFSSNNERLTIQPWFRWAKRQNGVILNKDILRYRWAGVGGFYLFVTRDRPLIYFAPRRGGAKAKGSEAYYVKWLQDGKEVQWADPTGGPIKEVLVHIPERMSVECFLRSHRVLLSMVYSLCAGFRYNALPTTVWTPGATA